MPEKVRFHYVLNRFKDPQKESDREKERDREIEREIVGLFVCLFGFLTSSSTTRLYLISRKGPKTERLTIYVLPHMRQS